MLKKFVIGKKVNGVTETSNFVVMMGDKIVLVDANGHSPKHVKTKLIGKDLHIFEDGSNEPSVILNDYATFQQSVQVQGLGENGAQYSYLPSDGGMELSNISTSTPTLGKQSEPFLSTNALYGIGILAGIGGVLAGSGGGGSSGGGSTSPSVTSSSSVLVDDVLIGVDYYINGVKAGTTDENGIFKYRVGDIVTFKVGQAEIGSFAPTVTDKVVTISDLAKGDETKIENIAKFLQSLDSDSNEASITIDPTKANLITTAVNVQNDPSAGGQITVTVTDPNLEALSDTTAPTGSISLSDDILNNGETAEVSIVFSEAVAGFSNDDVSVTNGTFGTLTTTDGGTTWKALFTPTSNMSLQSGTIIVTNTYTDQAGNAAVTNMTKLYTVNTKVSAAPTFTLTSDDATAGDGITHTNGVTVSGVVAGNTWEYSLNGGTTWVSGTGSTFNLVANTSYGAGDIQVRQIDGNGNVSSIGTNSDTILVDTTAPTVTITSDQTGIANIAGGDIVYTFTFSEAVSGFDATDISVTNGTKGTFTQTSATTYTLVVTPTAGLEDNIIVNVASGGATDTAGNGNSVAFQSTQAVDLVAPTATVTLADTMLSAGETTTVTIAFSEAVSNFDNSDVIAPNGTLSTFTTADGGVTWIALFTPSANISDASNVVQLLSTYTDPAGNGGALADSGNFNIDTRPSPISAPTFTLTSDDATAGDGITHTNGVTVSGVVAGNTWEYSLNGGTTWVSGTGSTFNLVANTSYGAGDIQVRQIDGNGNVSIIATNTQTMIVDTIVDKPIVSTIASNDVIDATENANLIITGSGEKGAAITLSKGSFTRSTVVDASGNWSMTINDAANAFGQGASTLSVTQTDIAGNISSTGTRNIFVDTVRPTLDSAVDVKANIGSDVITLTFTETLEPINFANASNFAIEINGKLYNENSMETNTQLISAISVSDKVVTLVLDTTIHNIQLGDTIRVGYIGATGDFSTAIQDLIGNDAPSFGYVTATVENTDTPPMLTNMVANSTNTITLTFNEGLNEAVANQPDSTDFTVKVNGVVNTVDSVAISGTNLVLTLTTPYDDQDLIEVTYNNGATLTNVIQDLNGIDAATFTYTISADRTAPTATIDMSDTSLLAGETSTVTITFSEAVKNFTLADLTAQNGTLSNLITNDNITWTATFTPTANITITGQTISLATTYTDNAGNTGQTATSSNYDIDTQAPHLLGSSLDISTHQMTFNFDKALDPVNFPATNMFTATDGVTVDPTDNTKLVNYTISNVAIHNDISTNTYQATVTIDPAIDSNTGTVWTLVYNDASGNDTFALQDINGNDVSSFTQALIIGSPNLKSMTADESANTIVMTFDTPLDTANLPALSDFLINVNGVDINGAISSITASGTDGIQLNMNPNQFDVGDSVKVTYTDPTAGNDTNAIQDSVNGYDMSTFSYITTAVI